MVGLIRSCSIIPNILVVGFSFHPTPGVISENPFTQLIKNKNEDRKWDGGEPPVELERVHLQSLVHARGVGHEGGQAGLEDQTKVENPVGHALSEDGILSGLADDQVSPLYDDNGDKERGVAGVLEDLAVPVSPLLMIRIFKIVDG